MIRRALFCLVVILLASQIPLSMAAQETYELIPCKIDIIASEEWQPDSAFEVRVRITVSLEINYKVRIHSVRVVVSSEGFHYYDTKQDDAELITLGEYWEKTFSFNFSTEKLSRGKNFTVSTFAIIDLYQVHSIVEYEQLWYNSDDPVIVTLYMPPEPSPTPTLTTTPEPTPKPASLPTTTIAIASSVIVAVVCIGLLVYFKKHKSEAKTS